MLCVRKTLCYCCYVTSLDSFDDAAAAAVGIFWIILLKFHALFWRCYQNAVNILFKRQTNTNEWMRTLAPFVRAHALSLSSDVTKWVFIKIVVVIFVLLLQFFSILLFFFSFVACCDLCSFVIVAFLFSCWFQHQWQRGESERERKWI